MSHRTNAVNVINIEAEAISNLTNLLTQDFDNAVEGILQTKGRTIICGMGKSGIIGKKMAATFASTGTPSFFMHPGEAFHGDLGMVTSDDLFIAISNSGETEEVLKLLRFLRDNKNTVIALTGNEQSTLASQCNYHLNISVPQEACPLQLAPTSSTTATLVMGDALAVALMEARNFKPENFARFHPGGSLGRRLLRSVQDEMITESLPVTSSTSSVIDVITTITTGQLGLAVVINDVNHVVGVITDGDLRRAIELHNHNIFTLTATDLMSSSPLSIKKDELILSAINLMEGQGVNRLLVLDSYRLVGILKK